MGTLYDSTDWARCPKPAAMYVDGHEGVAPASAFRPGDVDISVFAGDHHMLDCEPGNASPEACAARAVARERRAGYGDWTVIYVGDVENAVDKTNWYLRVSAALKASGTGWEDPAKWATVDGGKPGIYWGAVEAGGVPHAHRNPMSLFTQYREEAVGPQGQHYDLSETLDPFPYAPTAPPVIVKPVEEDTMKWIIDPVTKNQYLQSGFVLMHLSPSELPSASWLTGQENFEPAPDDTVLSRMAGYDPTPG